MVGQSKKAIAAMDEFVRGVPKDFIQNFSSIVDGYMVMPLEVRMRFGLWKEIVDAPMVDTVFPISTALQHYARGVAFGAMKEMKKARAEQRMFRDAAKRVPPEATFGNNSGAVLLNIAEEVLEGELLIHEGKLMAGIEHLKKGVQLEDGTSYDEPRDWIQPVRHILGAAYLSAHKPADAEAVYRADLKRIPNNGWSLHGLARALRMQNKNAEADTIQKQFSTCWKNADVEISTSCLCLKL
jgi:predicted Zn-dependent protease